MWLRLSASITSRVHIRSQLVAVKFLGLCTKLVLSQEAGGAGGGYRLIRTNEKSGTSAATPTA
ncbi:unnamed protein product [Ectocarpus fasciculatus]